MESYHAQHALEADIMEVDPISGNGAYVAKSGDIVTILNIGHRIGLHKCGEHVASIVSEQAKGYLFMTNPNPAALGLLVGKYEIIDHKYNVTPIVDEQTNPEEKREIHPLDFLLEKL
tara:strand:+ start:28897 stop:29247 length:351 start_codon:yes stop_codon:yes gene_type:complete